MPLPSESTVNGLFITLLFLGVACLIRSGGGRSGPPKRPKWRAIGNLLTGCAFLEFGLCTVLFVAISPRHEVTGSISDLSFHYGKYVSTTLTITGEGFPPPRLRIEGQTPKSIVEKERATARYVEYDRHVTDLKMLSGTTSGWAFHDADGPFFSLFLSLIGAGFLYGAHRTQNEFGLRFRAGVETENTQ